MPKTAGLSTPGCSPFGTNRLCVTGVHKIRGTFKLRAK